jgi:DNA-binding transcriptional LysR family regulator
VQVPVGERDARLERVLPDFTVAYLATWIVTHEDLRAVPRIRAVFDALVEAFAERPDQAGDEC